jgi:hypothetical protein
MSMVRSDSAILNFKLGTLNMRSIARVESVTSVTSLQINNLIRNTSVTSVTMLELKDLHSHFRRLSLAQISDGTRPNPSAVDFGLPTRNEKLETRNFRPGTPSASASRNTRYATSSNCQRAQEVHNIPIQAGKLPPRRATIDTTALTISQSVLNASILFRPLRRCSHRQVARQPSSSRPDLRRRGGFRAKSRYFSLRNYRI